MNVQLASDSFVRANESPLNPAAWSFGFPDANDGCQIVSDTVEAQSLTSAGVQLYTGVSFPSNQFSTIQVKSCNANGVIAVLTRGMMGGNLYAFGIGAGSGTGASATLSMQKLIAGEPNEIGATVAVINANDFLTLVAVDTTLIGMISGREVLRVFDSTFTSGAPGILVAATVSVSDAQGGPWSGGSASSGLLTVGFPYLARKGWWPRGR